MARSKPSTLQNVRGASESDTESVSPSNRGSPSKMGDTIKMGESINERLSAFIERQEPRPGSAPDLRMQLATVQRDMAESLRPLSAGQSYTSLNAFRNVLRHRFGTVTAAWRQILDPNMKGKLSFQDFCSACRDIGFCRKMKQLWEMLDSEKRGYIELDQIDPEAAAALKKFRALNRQKHGTLLKAWNWFDPRNKKRVDLMISSAVAKNWVAGLKQSNFSSG
jgi:hypothetical protein